VAVEFDQVHSSATGRDPTRTLRATRRRSRAVRFWRALLPLVAASLLVALVAYPILREDLGVAHQPEALRNEMDRLQFFTLDEDNRAITVTADTARQTVQDPPEFVLDRPMADVLTENDDWFALSAATGDYARADNSLVLSGEVTLVHSEGFELTTDRAHVDLDRRVATGRTAVAGQGPGGQLSAQGFRVDREGRRVSFVGPARLVVVPSILEAGVTQ